MIRKWDVTSEESKKKCVNEIITRVDEQAGSQFGIIAAQEIIDMVAQYLGPEAYNLGIEDAKKHISKKLADIDIELDVLKATS